MLSKLTKTNLNQNQIHQTQQSGGFLLLLALLFPLTSLGQAKVDNELPRDERGKYIYYEVVEKNSISPDSLNYRALAFFKAKKLKLSKENVVRQNDENAVEKEQLAADGKMIINKTAFVLTRPSGEVLYHFVFEAKEGKYRFWLTDFVFIPYQRDRYGNFVPSTVKGTPLEDSPGKLNAAEWASYVTATGKQSAAFAAEFKDYLSTPQKSKSAPKPKNSVSTKSW